MPKYFSKEGLAILERQIRYQTERVRQIGKEIGEAAGSNCDWHDNFAYEDARRRLDMETTSLARMKEELSDAVVVEIKEQRSKVSLGSTVRIRFGEQQKTYTIGAFGESAPDLGLLTYASPIGAALMGMLPSDEKSVTIGGKVVALEVIEILPASALYHALIQKITSQTAETK
jgi:transcription elongation factor GreA